MTTGIPGAGNPHARRFRLPGRPARWLPATLLALALLAPVVVVTSRVVASSRGRTAVGTADGTAVGTAPGAVPGARRGPPAGTPVPTTAPEADGPADVRCPPATVTVTDAASLADALSHAAPGATIQMADGLYAGRFQAKVPGTAEKPIFLCGGAGAVIDGGGVGGGYAVHLDGVSHWRLAGFTIRNSQKGLMADRVQQVVIQALTVEQIGDEAIHLRNFSSDNLVQANTVRNTGLRRDKFGEGIYIGTAQSNWCTVTECRPDLSDRNVVRRNTISATTAESIDIKEGTTGGVVSQNTFDGGSLSGSPADSWVDVKGNEWTITENIGRNAIQDGFQTHEVAGGWGTKNVFTSNTAEVNGPGWGFHLAPANGNRVSCDNRVTGAAMGFANVECR